MPPRPRAKSPRPRRSQPTGDAASGQRLQKVLAAAGLGSRRACEELIQSGRVEVDGKTVTELGSRVDPVSQTIRVDGEALPQPRKAYYLVHKVQGIVSTAKDPSGRPRVTDMVPPHLGRLFPVGRLVMSSEGLILLTNDGELANQLTHPRYGIEKMYQVQVAGRVEQATLDQLERGVHLAEGFAKVVGAQIKNYHKNSTILEMVLDEGRNREIRRLLARCGHKVQRLVRVAMGPLKLADLPPGAYRPLRRDEVEMLEAIAQNVPAGERAVKRPTSSGDGSRSLLRRRKKAVPKTGPAKSKPGKKGPAKKEFSAARKQAPKKRTIIGDEGTESASRPATSGKPVKSGKFGAVKRTVKGKRFGSVKSEGAAEGGTPGKTRYSGRGKRPTGTKSPRPGKGFGKKDRRS